MNCPLCEAQKITILEKINKNDLIKLYKKILGIDISYLISKDIDFCECQNCKLKFYKPIITGDEKFYNALQRFNWYYMNEKEEYKYSKKHIGPKDRVLEVGCGKGAFAKYLSTKDYVGLDISENAKRLAIQEGITIENETVQNFSKKHKNEFDIVVSFQVLEHVSDPKSFIEAGLETLKNGGKFIIGVPNENSFLKYVTDEPLNMPPHHTTRWSYNTFQYIALKYNLNIVEIYYEKLQNMHKQLYLSTLIFNSLFNPTLVSKSFLVRKIKKFIDLISRFLTRGLRDEMLPHGHTVVVVFEKK